MKRRLISTALCLLMLITTFVSASCGEEEADPNTLEIEGNTARAMTLTIWGVKGEGTTDEAVAAVEAAMSSITEAQFNTAIKLNLYFEDEYDEALEEKMNQIQAQLDLEAAEAAAKKQAEKEAKKNNETTAAESEETTEAADETILNEYGLPETLYPEVEDTQLDIFLMTDYDMLMKYNEKGVLSSLDAELSSTSKLIKTYVHPNFLTAGKVNGKTVAIINNQPIGEYTYMLLNKELMDEYYYDPDNFLTFNAAYDFIMEIGRNETDYVPLMGDISPININYFSLDGTPTLVGNMLDPAAAAGEMGAPRILPAVTNWNTYIKNIVRLKDNGYIGDETIEAGDKFGVGIIKGTWTDVEAFEEDYYINVIQNPQGTTDNICNGMFAVSTYTKSLERSMQIVTYLNTKSDLRNLFGYGIEDVHYSIDNDGVLTMISDDYNMELAYTGNMFVAHAPEGKPEDYWEAVKQQNLDAVLGPYYGFTYNETTIDTALLEEVMEFSARFYAELENQTSATINDFMTKWWSAAATEPCIKNWTSTSNELAMGKVYADWYKKTYPS